MIDTGRLNDFMHRFYGYGSWDAPLWFVGMEEGGGSTIDEIELRLKSLGRLRRPRRSERLPLSPRRDQLVLVPPEDPVHLGKTHSRRSRVRWAGCRQGISP
jgi:hypothetical protein